MTDALGWRAKFGVLAPSTNTINAAIWWMTLRDNGIAEKLYGCCRLLREF